MKNCDNCIYNLVCNLKESCDYCGRWDGWRLRVNENPPDERYVLIQLSEDYAGDCDNIVVGIYLEPDEYTELQNGWFLGHGLLDSVEDENVYAWRYLPEALNERHDKEMD